MDYAVQAVSAGPCNMYERDKKCTQQFFVKPEGWKSYGRSMTYAMEQSPS
jgi:hypothetical protein